MDKMKQEEFEQVGTYLYKLFCKLSRDVQIEKIQMQRAKGEKMAILDESNKPLINMFSDGQLSVFMLSYFSEIFSDCRGVRNFQFILLMILQVVWMISICLLS